MKFRDLSYRRPKGTVKGSVKKQGSESSGKNIPGSSERVQKASGEESGNTGDSGG